MRKTKKMLLGLMVCGAIALVGGMATNAYEAEMVSASAETTFNETETGVTKIHLRNKRLLMFLDACDYASTGGTTPANATYADYNTLNMIQVYTGETCVTLSEALAKNAANFDLNVYYNIWGETGSVSYQLDGDLYSAANVTKIVIPAGTQFPSYSYTNASGEAVAYTAKATYTFINNTMGNPDHSTEWSMSVELPKIDFENVTETSITGTYVRNGALEFALSANDYSVVGGSVGLGEKYAAYNFLEKVIIYDAEGNSTTWSDAYKASSANTSNPMGCWYNLWTNTGRIAFELSEEWQNKIAKVYIPAGTQFPSAAYTNTNGEALAYEVKQDTYFVKNGDNWQLDYTSLHFTDADTGISMVQWVNNQRLMLWLSENDYGTQAENKANVNVSADKLAATNMLEKILVNGTSLKDLGVVNADLNYWTYWGRVSVALSGIEVQTITIEEGCQFPSMAFAESGTPSRYVMKENVTYYAVGEADGDVLNCKKSANVTFDGQVVTAYVGMTIPADVVPANPTKENDESYTYTFDGWYNGETKWNIDSDVVAGDMALVSKFMQELREYMVTFIADGATVGTATYTVEDKDIEEPAVPEKEGYAGAWDAYELTSGDVTVNAVYTAIEYTITFVADGATVGTATYTVEDKDIEEPAVPEKEGYTGVWETYELTTGDITVNAVYTEIEIPPTSEPDEPTSSEELDEPADSSASEPDEPISSEEPDEPADSSASEPETSESTTSEPKTENVGGCGSVIGGVSAALAMVAAAAVAVVLKKKED